MRTRVINYYQMCLCVCVVCWGGGWLCERNEFANKWGDDGYGEKLRAGGNGEKQIGTRI